MAAVRGTGTRALQWLGLLLLAAVTAFLCYLALTRDTAVEADLAQDDASLGASETPGAAEPSATDQPTDLPTDQATDQPPSGQDVKVPVVPDQRRKDFTKGDDLPDGSVTYDSLSNSTGMKVTTQGLTHGPVEQGSADGLGLVETELKSDVRSLGFRVRFANGASGSAVLVAWQSSAVAALTSGADALPTGMRLVATPGTWSLSFLSEGGEEVLTEGTFDSVTGPLEFRVVRDGDELYVVDPTGLVTTATKARAGDLVGPFASWGLIESGPEMAPAVIESVWAG